MASIPHFAWPFRIVNGTVQTVEQDSAEEIAQNVEAVLNTIIGSRVDAPEYGVPDETFSTLSADGSASVYLAAVDAVEPRASVLGEARVREMTKQAVFRIGGSR